MHQENSEVLVLVHNAGLLSLVTEVVGSLGYPSLQADTAEKYEFYRDNEDIAVIVLDWEEREMFTGCLEDFNRRHPISGRFALINADDSEIKKHLSDSRFCCFIKKPFSLARLEDGIMSCIREFEVARAKLRNTNCPRSPEGHPKP